jgi:glycosyltransferase involved in cell wall biosynthesis
MGKIKILYFMDGIGNAGGIQEMVIKWMQNIDTDQFQIDILSYNTGKKDNYPERVKELGGNIYIIQTYVSAKYFINSFKQLKEFFEAHHDYDILHAHSSSKALFVMEYAKRYGIKTRILHSHCTQFVTKSKFALLAANLFKIPTNLLTTDYFACSPEAGSFLFGQKAVDKGNVIIAHNGINTNIFNYQPNIRQQVRKELGVEDKIVLGNVGRFRPQKNHSFLLKIFKAVSEKEKNAILICVGNGELENKVKTEARELGIYDKIMFLGVRSDVPNLMQAMDVLVMPSLFEGLPVTGVEAQAVGLPCVFATTISTEAKILDNTCFVNLSGSLDEWATNILDVAINNQRTNTTAILRDKGYDITIEAKNLGNYYKKCVTQ